MKQTWNALETAARDCRLVILCGAGVSRPEPAGLPTVEALVDGILGNISEHVPEIGDALQRSLLLFNTAPFEVFVAVLEQALLSRTLELLEPLTRGTPNVMHRYVGRLMASGRARAVITTNFDNLIERALGTSRDSVPVAYGWEDAARCLAEPASTKLLKVHGSFVDMNGKDIATNTIRTTIDGVFRSSRHGPIAVAAQALDSATILVIGYSGRDRLDVIPFLASLHGCRVIWVHHKDVDEVELGSLDGGTQSPVKRLVRAGVGVTEVAGPTERLLETLVERTAAAPLDDSDGRLTSVPRSLRRTGFVPPIFPKYAGALGGYLLLWAAISPQAAELALASFLSEHGDDERRVSCNVLIALGHSASCRAEAEEAERLLTMAVRAFSRLGDFHGVIRGHYAFASALLRAGQQASALEMVDRAATIAEREQDELGAGLLDFMAGQVLEEEGRTAEAQARYEAAWTAGQECGHLWLEAGALQGLVRSAGTGAPIGDRDIERLLRSLELTHWTSGGSAPAPWMVDMVDSFWAVDTLGKGLANLDENNARSIIESNDFLADVGLDVQIRGAIVRHS